MSAAKKTAQLLRDLNEDLENEQAKRLKAERAKKKLEAELKEMTSLMDRMNESAKDQQKELKKLRRQIIDLESDLNSTKSKLSIAEEFGADRSQSKGEKYDKAKQKARKVEKKLEEMTEERDILSQTLERERRQFRKEKDVLNAELTEIRLSWEKDIAAKERYRQQTSDMQSLVANTREVELDLNMQKTKMERELTDLHTKLDKNEVYIKELEKENAELEKIKFKAEFKAKKENVELEDKAQELQTKLDLWMKKTQKGSETKVQLSAEKQKVQKELQEMQERYETMTRDFQRQKQEFEKDMEKIRSQNEQKEIERSLRLKAMDEKRARDEALLRQLKLGVEDDADKARARHKQEIKDARKALADLQREKEDMELAHDAEIQKLRGLMDEKCAALQRQLDQAQADAEDAAKEQQRAEAALRRYRLDQGGVADDLQLERDELAQRCETLQKKLRTALEEREAEHTAARAASVGGEQLSVKLRTVREALDESQEKLLAAKRKHESMLSATKEELRLEREKRWELEKTAEKLEEENIELKWYFLPEGEKKQKPKKKVDSEWEIEQRRIADIKAELDEIRNGLRDPNDMRTLPIADIQAMLIDSLETLPDNMKEDHAQVLAALMSAMDMLNYSLRAKLGVCVALTRHIVKPQIIYELINIAEHMMEKTVNAMDSPEGIVFRVQRDVFLARKKGIQTINFEEELMDKLVWLRARRTGKEEEECRQNIIDAVDHNE